MFTNRKSTRKAVAVKLRRFWCGEIPFIAYQLPNGEIAMSQTQSLPNESKAIVKIAADFISTNKLKTIRATLPNHALAVLYPLPTITALWNHLHNMGKLPEREKLMSALLAGRPVKDDNHLLRLTPADFLVKVEQAPETLAKVVLVQVEKFSLRVLLQSGAIFIPDHEGLTVIGVPLSWLLELNPAQKKAQILWHKGFSFKEELLCYQELDVFQVKTHSRSDWLILWEYFASKGNTKALSLLRHLAYRGLESRVG
jgi:hypothetical protein